MAQRRFAGGHHDHHDGHDDHHQHVEKAALDHKFLTADAADKRFLVFNGLKPTTPVTIALENPYRHQNDKPLYE